MRYINYTILLSILIFPCVALARNQSHNNDQSHTVVKYHKNMLNPIDSPNNKSVAYSGDKTPNILMGKKSIHTNHMSTPNSSDNRKGTIYTYYNSFFEQINKYLTICNSDIVENWEKNETDRHLRTIKDKKYDLIVLPVQESKTDNDRVARLMSSRLIAHEIKQQTNKKIMSPELALRLLGSHQITFDIDKINDLSLMVGADIVYLFKKKIENDRFVQITAILTDSNGLVKKEVSIEVESENIGNKIRDTKANFGGKIPELNIVVKDTLEVLFEDVAEQLVNKLFDSKPAEKTLIYSDQQNWILPNKINELPQKAISSIDHTVYLQFIALLTPKILDYERRRLFERSLLSLKNVDPASKYYNLLNARALFHLYRRPFALHYLKDVSLPAEKALKEFINGNLPELQNITNDIDSPLLHASSVIELNSLRFSYDKKRMDQDVYKVPNEEWRQMIVSASHDGDDWYSPDNVVFFNGLKGLYPRFDNILEKTLHGIAVIREKEVFDRNGDIFADIFGFSDDISSIKEGSSYEDTISEPDIWNLYKNISIANMLRDLRLSAQMHGSYTTAINKAKHLEVYLAGHPTFLSMYSRSLLGMSKMQKGSKRQSTLKDAYKTLQKVYSTSCEVTNDTTDADSLMNKLMRSYRVPKENHKKNREHFHRMASNGFYPSSYLQSEKSDFANYKTLPFSNTDIKSLNNKDLWNLLAEEAIDLQFESRFNGHPAKTIFLAKRYFSKGEESNGLSILRKAVESGDEDWETYSELATRLVEKEQYKEASTVYMKYPLFTNIPDGKHVAVSNYAFRAGYQLYNSGRYDEAKPLFEIAASIETGASSQYRAIQKLSLMNGDYTTFLQASLHDANRYNNFYSFYYYLTYLYILGFNADADAGFNELIKRKNSNLLWISKFIGNRAQNKSFSNVAEMTKVYIEQNHKKLMALHLLAAESIIDRHPTKTDILEMDNLERIANVNFFNESAINKFNAYLSNNILRIFKSTNYSLDIAISGSYSSFINSFSHLLNNNYKECLNSILSFYKSRNGSKDPIPLFLLPYLTMAASEEMLNDEIQELSTVLSRIEANRSLSIRKQYDLTLAEAVIHSHFNRFEKSFEFLERAYNYPEKSIFTYLSKRPMFRRYQLLQVSEWLFHKTKDKRYIDKALVWAKQSQKKEPEHAWAYSFEALYSSNNKDRIIAAAYATFLDPNSYWLSQVEKNIRRESELWWQQNNPFTIKDPEQNKQSI